MVADSRRGFGDVPDVSKDVPEVRDRLRQDSTLSQALPDESVQWLVKAKAH
jgi:hypothetical protein